MRVQIYTVAIPLLTAVAFAQDTPPQQPQRPSEQTAPAADEKTSKDKTKDKNKDMEKDKSAGMASSSNLPEMKTQTYSGTLMDASCAGGSATPATAATPSASADRTSASADKTSADGQACPVSASTTKFALKTKDGQTVKFDDVGNMRAQEALKAKKKWTESAAASKPIRAKASGVLNGDKLTVMSID